ncbi:MAG: TIGR03086 family metal-binding protein [Streptosporangiaceae bacterium]
MTQITDPRELHQRAMAQTESIVAAVEPDQLTLPTPCTEFDVRELLSHVVGGLNRIAIMGEGGDALAVEPRADGVPDDGWLAAYRTASSRARGAWADDATLDALVVAPWGKVPGRIALSGYVQEILTHGWDLVRATGQPADYPADLVERALAQARPGLAKRPDGPGAPFAAEVPVPAGAPAIDRLAGFLGRQP